MADDWWPQQVGDLCAKSPGLFFPNRRVEKNCRQLFWRGASHARIRAPPFISKKEDILFLVLSRACTRPFFVKKEFSFFYIFLSYSFLSSLCCGVCESVCARVFQRWLKTSDFQCVQCVFSCVPNCAFSCALFVCRPRCAGTVFGR